MKKTISIGIMLVLILSVSPSLEASNEKKEEKTRMIVVKEEEREVKNLTIDKGEPIKMEIMELTKREIEIYEQDQSIRILEEDRKAYATGQQVTYGYQAIKGEVYPSYGLTGKGIKVAVIDSGIMNHEDLKIAGGKTFVEGTTSFKDDNGHGTHVAGIIGAQNNDVGIVGVSPDIELYALKVLDSTGTGFGSDIVSAIMWSIENKMDIVNMSIALDGESRTVKEAVEEAERAGIIVIASAGNNRSGVVAPAKYSSAIAVSATNKANEFANDFSNYGPEVMFAAPGRGIVSTYLNNTYVAYSGTSMSAPFVSGYFAILKQKYPSYSIEELKAVAQKDALDLGQPGKDEYYGYGLIQQKKSDEIYKITKKTALYNAQGSRDIKGLIEPQEVKALEYGDLGWVKIEYGDEIYWVKDGYTERRIYIPSYSGLYGQQGGINKQGGIPPQFVIVFEDGSDGWVRIRTYKGDLWLKNGYTNERITFTKLSGLYKQPNGAEKVGVVSPQTIEALEEKNGWYKINSYAGIVWIKDGVNHTRIYLGKASGLYNTAQNAERITIIPPQYIIQLREENGWRLIQTYLGEKWIKEGVSDIRVGITKNSGIFTAIGGKKVGTLAPQTINGVAYMGNGWYKINSYKGVVYTKNGVQ